MSVVDRNRFACIAEARVALSARGFREAGTLPDGSYVYEARDFRRERVAIRKLGFLDVIVSPIAWNYEAQGK